MEYQQKYDIAIVLTTTFNFGLQIMFIIIVLAFILGLPELRAHALAILLCKRLSPIPKITPVVNIQRVYFDQLENMWERQENEIV